MALTKKTFFDFALLRRVFGYAAPYKNKFYLSVALAIFLAVITPIRPLLIQLTVDKYIIQSLGEMVYSEQQRKFGSDKSDTLPNYCRTCEVRFACHGECPKHRFIETPDGEPGLNYLCPAYKRFFNHVDPYMKTMRDLLTARQSPALIMRMLAEEARAKASRPAGGPARRSRRRR